LPYPPFGDDGDSNTITFRRRIWAKLN
jgi:hypothetical protein